MCETLGGSLPLYIGDMTRIMIGLATPIHELQLWLEAVTYCPRIAPTILFTQLLQPFYSCLYLSLYAYHWHRSVWLINIAHHFWNMFLYRYLLSVCGGWYLNCICVIVLRVWRHFTQKSRNRRIIYTPFQPFLDSLFPRQSLSILWHRSETREYLLRMSV